MKLTLGKIKKDKAETKKGIIIENRKRKRKKGKYAKRLKRVMTRKQMKSRRGRSRNKILV